MPAFNAEKTIVRAIDSVLKQTYPNIELLIINDGSTDNTSEIVSKYRDSRVALINQGNKGLSGARNTGLENIKGEYVTFLDSDDWCEADFVERLISSMTVNKAQLSVCGMIAHKNAGVSYSASFESTHNSFFDNAEFLSKLESGIMNSVCNKLYQTSIIHGESLKFRKIAIVEDLDFNLRYLDCVKRVCFIPNYLYHYDNNHSVLTTKVSSDMFDNYIHIHAWFFSKVSIAYFPIISSFVYHQYVALSVRYVNLCIAKKISRKEVRNVLNYYLANPFIQYSIRTHHSKFLGEKVLNILLINRQIDLLLFYLNFVNKKKQNQ